MKTLLRYIKESISRNYKQGLFDIEDNIADVTGGLREMLVNWLVDNITVNYPKTVSNDFIDNLLSEKPIDDGETYEFDLNGVYATFKNNPPVPLLINSKDTVAFEGNFNPTNISTRIKTRAMITGNNQVEEFAQNGFIITSIQDVDEVDMSRIGSALETPEIVNVKKLKWGSFKQKHSLSWVNIRECDVVELKYLKNIDITTLTLTNIDKIVGLEHINAKNTTVHIEGAHQEIEIGPDVVLKEISIFNCNKITGMDNLAVNVCSIENYNYLQSFDELPYKCELYISDVQFPSNMDNRELKKLGKSHKLKTFFINNKKIL